MDTYLQPLDEATIETQIFRYQRGAEMTLQQALRSMDPYQRTSLCFVAAEGMDGDAILGFTRSLRKEYHLWRVYCVVFPSSWPLDEQEHAARILCAHPHAEQEMLLGYDRSVNVPRIIASSGPKQAVCFDSTAPWVLLGSTLTQVSKPLVPSDHVLVHVTSASRTSSSCWAFNGRVEGSSSIYLGITFEPLTNYTVAHRGSLLELKGIQEFDRNTNALAAIISVLAIGRPNYSDPQRLHGARVLVTHSETTLGRNICQLYESRGFHVLRLPSQASTPDARATLAQRPRFIVSGRLDQESDRDVDTMLTRLQSGIMFKWDDPSTGVPRILAEDPWAIGDALRMGHADGSLMQSEIFMPPLSMLDIALPAEVPLRTTIFDPDKSYVLIGGIGGLGLHVAHWMYKVRVLTRFSYDT